MEKPFKINVYFDEKGEMVEKMIAEYIIKNENYKKK